LWSLHILSNLRASLRNQSLSFSKLTKRASYFALWRSLDAFSLSSLISFIIAYILFLKAMKKSFSWPLITSEIFKSSSCKFSWRYTGFDDWKLQWLNHWVRNDKSWCQRIEDTNHLTSMALSPFDLYPLEKSMYPYNIFSYPLNRKY
jgi:hypothetical protein